MICLFHSVNIKKIVPKSMQRYGEKVNIKQLKLISFDKKRQNQKGFQKIKQRKVHKSEKAPFSY